MENVINGRDFSKQIRKDLSVEILKIEDTLGIRPKLKVIIVGENPGAVSYVRGVEKMSKLTKVTVETTSYNDTITEEQFLDEIEKINKEDSVNGVLIMMPLPKHISSEKVYQTLNPIKDIDGLTAMNIGSFYKQEEHHPASTPKGVDNLIDLLGLDVKGIDACVIGASLVVGRPMAEHLLRREATVSICHKETKDLSRYTRDADLIVVAAGVPNLVKADMVKEGVIIFDVGVNMVNGQLCGDCDFNAIVEKAKLITPVPGGVGPMTIAQTFMSTFNAFKIMNKL